MHCQTHGYLAIHRASPLIDWYQIILLVDRDKGCQQLAQSATSNLLYRYAMIAIQC